LKKYTVLPSVFQMSASVIWLLLADADLSAEELVVSTLLPVANVVPRAELNDLIWDLKTFADCGVSGSEIVLENA
jgi:hypothetical protein